MLYHVSSISGLKRLIPRVSTHNKPYVYAVDNLTTGLLFGARKDDFDFMLYTDDRNRPVICECYIDAFQKIYKGKSCSVYVVKDTGFLRGITGWTPELVCDTEVEVQQEITVTDLYARLLDEEKNSNLIIRRYSKSPDYQSMISDHIMDRLIRFDLLKHFDKNDIRGELYFRQLIDALKNSPLQTND